MADKEVGLTMNTPAEIADAVLERHYGAGTDYAEPNEHGESGLTLALVEDGTDGEWIREHIIEAVEVDRAQRAITWEQLDELLAAWDAYDGDTDGFYEEWLERLNEPEVRLAKLTAEWEAATGDTASDYILSEDDWRVGLSDAEAREAAELSPYVTRERVFTPSSTTHVERGRLPDIDKHSDLL